MSELYLCEKPSQARDIARILGVRHKGAGCLTGTANGQSISVTWCYGHLLEMLPPDAYDPAWKRWNLNHLPIVPREWRLAPRPAGLEQLTAIQNLLKDTATVIIATDADREGELIAREILTLAQWRGPVRRLWLSALDDASIRAALAAIQPGIKTEPLWQAGLGRARADWLVGMNLTRAYTVIGQRAGYVGVLSVGRVQTPTLKLIVDRDRTIETFVPVAYFEVSAWFVLTGDVAYHPGPDAKFSASLKNAPQSGVSAADERRLRARWVPPADVADREGRCLNHAAAARVVAQVADQIGTITQAETKRIKEPPPLPFDLATLQQVASRRWAMGAQLVLDSAQALYEKHKAITYPRTDCPYLPTSQHAAAPAVLAALAATDPVLADLVRSANPTLRSRAWDDAQISAHHAIIPTAAQVNPGRMNSAEARVYDLIRRRYLAQFYPAYEYDQTVVTVTVAAVLFRATGRVMRMVGWRTVLDADLTSSGADQEPTLPALHCGEPAQARAPLLAAKQTRPPPRYTEGTLIAAMKNVGRMVADDQLKKVLKETAGIGTEATRAGIIEILVKRGFLVREGKRDLISTAAGRALVDILPAAVTDPATTALWEQGLDEIARGAATLEPFLERQAQWISTIVAPVKAGQMPSGLAALAALGENNAPAHAKPAPIDPVSSAQITPPAPPWDDAPPAWEIVAPWGG